MHSHPLLPWRCQGPGSFFFFCWEAQGRNVATGRDSSAKQTMRMIQNRWSWEKRLLRDLRRRRGARGFVYLGVRIQRTGPAAPARVLEELSARSRRLDLQEESVKQTVKAFEETWVRCRECLRRRKDSFDPNVHPKQNKNKTKRPRGGDKRMTSHETGHVLAPKSRRETKSIFFFLTSPQVGAKFESILGGKKRDAFPGRSVVPTVREGSTEIGRNVRSPRLSRLGSPARIDTRDQGIRGHMDPLISGSLIH